MTILFATAALELFRALMREERPFIAVTKLVAASPAGDFRRHEGKDYVVELGPFVDRTPRKIVISAHIAKRDDALAFAAQIFDAFPANPQPRPPLPITGPLSYRGAIAISRRPIGAEVDLEEGNPWRVAVTLVDGGPRIVVPNEGGVMTEGPYARISVLRPHDGKTVDFESGYIRHLEWHRQAKDPWSWYGWTVWAGDRQRWFVYATFGHSAANFDNPVSPADDERDNIVNVTPHAEFVGSALYEFLPALSRGTGKPQATPRLELTTVDLEPGGEKAFEAALSAAQSSLREETLWYRMVAGGTAPRYVRLRPRANLSAFLNEADEQALPSSVAKATIEILTLRPAMSYGL